MGTWPPTEIFTSEEFQITESLAQLMNGSKKKQSNAIPESCIRGNTYSIFGVKTATNQQFHTLLVLDSQLSDRKIYLWIANQGIKEILAQENSEEIDKFESNGANFKLGIQNSGYYDRNNYLNFTLIDMGINPAWGRDYPGRPAPHQSE